MRPLTLLFVFMLMAAADSAVRAAEKVTPLVSGSLNLRPSQSDLATISLQIATITKQDKVSVWGLSQVQNKAWAQQIVSTLKKVTGTTYKYAIGSTGGAERLAVIYDSDRLAAKDIDEIFGLNIGGNVRAPLVVTFRDHQTDQKFKFMVNHLYRTDAQRRLAQAIGLTQWIKEIKYPVIAVGNYNFDWVVSDGQDQVGAGFKALTAANAFTWVKPKVLQPTICDNKSPTIQDFIFAANSGTILKSDRSEILNKDDKFCQIVAGDNAKRALTHVPVIATFSVLASPKVKMKKPGKVASGSSSSDPSDQLESLFWQSIQNSDDPKMFDAYLKKYPNGTFASIAKIKLQSLQRPTVTTQSAQSSNPTLASRQACRETPKTRSRAGAKGEYNLLTDNKSACRYQFCAVGTSDENQDPTPNLMLRVRKHGSWTDLPEVPFRGCREVSTTGIQTSTVTTKSGLRSVFEYFRLPPRCALTPITRVNAGNKTVYDTLLESRSPCQFLFCAVGTSDKSKDQTPNLRLRVIDRDKWRNLPEIPFGGCREVRTRAVRTSTVSLSGGVRSVFTYRRLGP